MANITCSQFSSTYSTPALSQPDSTSTPDMSPPDISIYPFTSHLVNHRYSGGMTFAAEQLQGQEQGQASSTVGAMTETEAIARIGSVLGNGKFVCDAEGCGGQTFARQAELRRHFITLHATNKPNFWCHVLTCPRSMSRGGKAFHRKDKLMAHVRSMHSAVQ